MNKGHKILLIAVFLSLAGMMFSAYSRQNTWERDADRRKASELYLQAVDAFVNENYGLYSALIERAYRLDPADPELTARYGEWLVITMENDTAAVSRGFRMMRDAYDSRQPDLFEGMKIADMAFRCHRWTDNLAISEKLSSQFPDNPDVALKLIQSYMVQSRLGDTSYVGKTLTVIDSLESKFGMSPALSDVRIRNYAITRDTMAIMSELGRLIDNSPADSYTALAVGQVYNSLSRPDSALFYFNRACELDSTNGNAILARARLYQQQGDSATFDSEAFRAIKSQDVELETKMNIMVNYVNMLYRDSTQYQRIDSMFETLLDVNPGEVDVHRLYAEYLARTGKTERAADQMNYVVSLNRADRSSWLFLAQLLFTDEKYEQAAKTLDEASGYFPSDYTITEPEALFYSIAGMPERTVAVLEAFPDSTITDPSRRSTFFSMLGDNYYKIKDRNKAFSAYDRAVSLDPTNFMALNNLAYYYAESDTLLDNAESMIQRVVRHQPDNPTFTDTYAWVAYKKGDYPKAKEMIDRTIELLKLDETMDSIDTMIDDLVEVNDEVANSEKAVEEEVEEVIENEELPGSADVYDHAGDIYFRCGNIIKAVEFWNEALRREPENPDIIKEKIKHRKIIENAP